MKKPKSVRGNLTLGVSALAIAFAGITPSQTSAQNERARRVSQTTAEAAPTSDSRFPKNGMLRFESARSDKFTGGLKRAKFKPGDGDIRITVDVPAFRLTLWQSGAVVAVYPIGIGLFDFQVPIGERQFTQMIYNPPWIPPGSAWVQDSKTVKPGEVITAEDPRNPLGKMKIPLGSGYLIHEARGVQDLGNLVSHGCVRMLRKDIYDLTEKIIAARELPVTAKQIAGAKTSKKQFAVELDRPVPIRLDYDTQIVEDGALQLYPDVYEKGTNTPERLRHELETNGIDPQVVDDASIAKLLTRPTKISAFVTPISSVKENLALTAGKPKPIVVASPVKAVIATKAVSVKRNKARS